MCSPSATNDADAIIFHPQSLFSMSIAEARKIPAILGALQPLTATRKFPLSIIRSRPAGEAFNAATYFSLRLVRSLWGQTENRLRRELLDLPPQGRWSDLWAINGRKLDAIYGFSAKIQPAPPDWPLNAYITGYLFIDSIPGNQLPPSLQAFIERANQFTWVLDRCLRTYPLPFYAKFCRRLSRQELTR